jgi:hypothetical protein
MRPPRPFIFADLRNFLDLKIDRDLVKSRQWRALFPIPYPLFPKLWQFHLAGSSNLVDRSGRRSGN